MRFLCRRTPARARPGARTIVVFWMLCLAPLADALTRRDVHEHAPGEWHGALATATGRPLLTVRGHGSGDAALPAAGARLAISVPALGAAYDGAWSEAAGGWHGVHRVTFGAGPRSRDAAPDPTEGARSWADLACAGPGMDARGSRRR